MGQRSIGVVIPTLEPARARFWSGAGDGATLEVYQVTNDI